MIITMPNLTIKMRIGMKYNYTGYFPHLDVE